MYPAVLATHACSPSTFDVESSLQILQLWSDLATEKLNPVHVRRVLLLRVGGPATVAVLKAIPRLQDANRSQQMADGQVQQNASGRKVADTKSREWRSRIELVYGQVGAVVDHP